MSICEFMEFNINGATGGVVIQDPHQAPIEYYYKDDQGTHGEHFTEMGYVKEGEAKFFYGKCPSNIHIGNLHIYDLGYKL